MYINGAHQANDSPEMVTIHRMIGLVPALLHGSVRDALVVGMGGGATPGTLARFARDTVTIVEISPSVVEAARAFRGVNHDIVDSPKAEIVIADGRNYLALTDRSFDLIAADSISPLQASSSNLYSLDYYRTMAPRLRPHGLALQWVDGTLRDHEQRMLMRTFVTAFPYAALWDRGDRFVIGSNQPIAIDREAIEARLTPEVRVDLSHRGIGDVDAFVSGFTLRDAELRSELGRGPVISDDHPYNEYVNLLRTAALWRFLPHSSTIP
jgi:spermidine synthase